MNTPYVFKKCSKCGRWLVANTVNFYRKKGGRYGLRTHCKQCENAHSKEWYQVNIEKQRARGKLYRENNKEKEQKRNKKYKEEHKEEIREYSKKYNKKYYEENKEKILEQQRKYYETPQGQVVRFNNNNKRRKREQRGNGITVDQWLEMLKFFDWKCAYSGEYIGGKKNQSIRTIDHIVPLAKGGAHEVWNCVPMDRSLNSRKNDKDLEEWYPQQDFYNEDRLNKIYKWCKYAYNKWGKK